MTCHLHCSLVLDFIVFDGYVAATVWAWPTVAAAVACLPACRSRLAGLPLNSNEK